MNRPEDATGSKTGFSKLSSGLRSLVRGSLRVPGIEGLKQLTTRAAASRQAVCGIESCQATAMLRNVDEPGRRNDRSDRNDKSDAGIRVGESWYCSSRCFEEGVETRLLDLLFQQPGKSLHADRMPLNLLLMSRGWLSHEQSIAAVGEQKSSGDRLDEVLVRLGLVTEAQITQVRAARAGYPVYSLLRESGLSMEAGPTLETGVPIGLGSGAAEETLFDGDVRAPWAPELRQTSRGGIGVTVSSGISIPRMLIERYRMLPLHYVARTGRLVIGFVERVDHGLLYAIEQMTDSRAEPCFLNPADFRDQLLRPENPANNEFRFERPARPLEMAKTVCGYALEIGADEARFARARDYLWARLRGTRGEIDLLFRHPRSKPQQAGLCVVPPAVFEVERERA